MGDTKTGTTPKKNVVEYWNSQDYPFVRPADIFDGYVCYDNNFVTEKAYNEYQRIAVPGTILMVCIGTIGKLNMVNRNCTFNQQINAITPFVVSSGFLRICMKASYFQEESWRRSSSTTISILNKGKWEKIPVPLPGLPEQNRIVAQVDKLMAYCDELQAAKDRERECQARLCESAFTVLEQSSDDQELSKHWNFCAENFQALEQTSENVSKLRNTILQLAVQGRLTQQRAEDGSARELLAQIKEAKRRDAETQRGNGQRVQKAKKLPPIEEGEIPFEIPESWQWVRLGEIQVFVNGFAFKSNEYSQDGVGIVRIGDIQNGTIETIDMVYVTQEYLDRLSVNMRVNPGELVIAMSGATTGKLGFNKTKETFLLNQRVGKFIFIETQPVYASFYLHTQIESNLKKSAGSAIPNLSTKQINELLFPLPPLTEQKRIVAQVDKLMAYCDELEAGIRKREEAAGSFCKAVVAGVGVE